MNKSTLQLSYRKKKVRWKLLFEIGWPVLLERRGEGDGGHDGHGGPLFRVLTIVNGLRRKVGVIHLVAFHFDGALCELNL